MRAQIAINKSGVTQASSVGGKPPPGGILARRTNRKFSVFLDRDVTIPALINLIRTLRAIDGEMTLNDQETKPMNRQKLCFVLARRALGIIERKHDTLFKSDLEIFSAEISALDHVPENLTRLVGLNFTNLDAPAALLRASEAMIENLVLVAQNRSMRLQFLALPESIAWPKNIPPLSLPIDETLPEPICTWLTIAYETTLCIRKPVYHHGVIAINDQLRLPFQRILNPITAGYDRPNHFRILTSASVSGPQARDIVII